MSDSLTLVCPCLLDLVGVLASGPVCFRNRARLLSLLGSGLEGRGRVCEDGDSPTSRCLDPALRVLRPLADVLGRILSRCVYKRLYTRGGIGGRGSIVGRSNAILSLRQEQLINIHPFGLQACLIGIRYLVQAMCAQA